MELIIRFQDNPANKEDIPSVCILEGIVRGLKLSIDSFNEQCISTRRIPLNQDEPVKTVKPKDFAEQLEADSDIKLEKEEYVKVPIEPEDKLVVAHAYAKIENINEKFGIMVVVDFKEGDHENVKQLLSFTCYNYDDDDNLPKSYDFYRAEIKALHKAIEICQNDLRIRIFVKSGFVYRNTKKSSLEHWSKNEWKSKEGKFIRSHDLFEQIYYLLNERSERGMTTEVVLLEV